MTSREGFKTIISQLFLYFFPKDTFVKHTGKQGTMGNNRNILTAFST
jgi:hypothetical protein